MIWAAPGALALAVLAALPLLAHLWSRKRPAALPFPTLRFLRASSPVSRRLRRVQEWPLLLLRLAIVAVVCAAAAGPTLAARWREHAWHTRLHRVIVVDADITGAAASAAVNDLQKGAASSTVLGPTELSDILDEAIAEADRSAAERRTELAVVWSGSRATLAAADVSDIPARVGIRLVPVGDVNEPAAHAATDATTGGIAIETDDAALRSLLQADVESLVLPSSTTSIRLRWTGKPAARQAPASIECRGTREPVLRALDEMSADARVRDAADRSLTPTANADLSAEALSEVSRAKAERRTPNAGQALVEPASAEAAAEVSAEAPATVLARSASGEVLLRGWAEDGCLVLDLDAEPRSPLTWWALVSAREALARVDRMASTERWSADDLARVNRDGLLPADASLPGGLDTRRAWGVALALLLIEQAWRRRGVAVGEGEGTASVNPPVGEPVDAA